MNNKEIIKSSTASYEKIRTRSGQHINKNADIWNLNEGYANFSINFEKLREMMSQEMIDSLKENCAWYASHVSAHHTNNMINRVKWLFTYIYNNNDKKVIHQLTEIDVINYLSQLDRETEYYLGSVKYFLLRWSKIFKDGISVDCINFLETHSFNGNEKGIAVLTHDPKRGALTSIDQESIYSELKIRFSKWQNNN